MSLSYTKGDPLEKIGYKSWEGGGGWSRSTSGGYYCTYI